MLVHWVESIFLPHTELRNIGDVLFPSLQTTLQNKGKNSGKPHLHGRISRRQINVWNVGKDTLLKLECWNNYNSNIWMVGSMG
jgi:hypothetical protein